MPMARIIQKIRKLFKEKPKPWKVVNGIYVSNNIGFPDAVNPSSFKFNEIEEYPLPASCMYYCGFCGEKLGDPDDLVPRFNHKGEHPLDEHGVYQIACDINGNIHEGWAFPSKAA